MKAFASSPPGTTTFVNARMDTRAETVMRKSTVTGTNVPVEAFAILLMGDTSVSLKRHLTGSTPPSPTTPNWGQTEAAKDWG